MKLADKHENVTIPIGIPGTAGIQLTVVEVFDYPSRGEWAVFDARERFLGHVVRESNGRWTTHPEGHLSWFADDRAQALAYIARRTLG